MTSNTNFQLGQRVLVTCGSSWSPIEMLGTVQGVPYRDPLPGFHHDRTVVPVLIDDVLLGVLVFDIADVRPAGHENGHERLRTGHHEPLRALPGEGETPTSTTG